MSLALENIFNDSHKSPWMNFERNLYKSEFEFQVMHLLCTSHFSKWQKKFLMWAQINIFTKKWYFSPNHIDIKSIQQMNKYVYFDATEATEIYICTHMIHLMVKNNLIHVSVILYKINLISGGRSVNFCLNVRYA